MIDSYATKAWKETIFYFNFLLLIRLFFFKIHSLLDGWRLTRVPLPWRGSRVGKILLKNPKGRSFQSLRFFLLLTRNTGTETGGSKEKADEGAKHVDVSATNKEQTKQRWKREQLYRGRLWRTTMNGWDVVGFLSFSTSKLLGRYYLSDE